MTIFFVKMPLFIRSVISKEVCQKLQRFSKPFSKPVSKFHNRSFHQRGAVIKEPLDNSKRFSILARPLVFTSCTSVSCFAACAIWQYEDLRSQLKDVNKRVTSLYGIPEKYGVLRAHAYSVWAHFSPGQKTVASIIFANFAVFVLWKIPFFRDFMYKFFTASPFTGASSISLFCSMFSHVSLLHLSVNMYALWTFSAPIVNIFGKEQFIAMYISGGLIAGFCSHFFKFLVGSTIPSLGASGAVLAVVGAVSMQFPNSQVSIMLVDQIYPHSFSASNAIKGLIAIDFIGLLARWKYIDHAAHLGGVLYGIWYLNYGHKLIWGNRENFLKWWHSKRGKL